MPNTLSITDNRTGLKYELPITDGTVKAVDLTQIKTDINPDGVLFYKIWNGHQPHAGSKGSMPAFKVQTTRDEVWRVIEYVKTLRNPAT